MINEDTDREPVRTLDELGPDPVRMACLTVQQPIGEFYVGVMGARDLVDISHADVRRLEDREFERYLGFQRGLSDRRVKELRRYVREIDASFPTSILLAVQSSDALASSGELHLRRDDEIATIIDGQHRIAGLQEMVGEAQTFESIVTIFVDMHVEDQARVFATINLTQTKVNKSLALDLYEFARTRSPQKTAHDVAKLLNSDSDSPLYHRIKMLGVATPDREETISQALLVEGLLRWMSRDSVADRNAIKEGGELSLLGEEAWNRLPFRNMFIRGDDIEIAENTWNCFQAVAERWPRAWGEVRLGHQLNRNTGVWAILNFLGVCYARFGDGDSALPVDKYRSVFDCVELGDDDFTREDFPSGSPGRAALRRILIAALENASEGANG